MSTENQIHANRENAKLSTGPQTEQGKAASSQNARKHGLSTGHLYLADDQRDEFQELYNTYFLHLRPTGELQLEYFERLVHAKWNVNIARELQVLALSTGDEKRIHTSTRYLHQWERTYDKSLKLLKQEQADFALRAIPQNEPIAKIASEAHRIARLQERTQQPAARAAILAAIGRFYASTPLIPTADLAPDPCPQPLDDAA